MAKPRTPATPPPRSRRLIGYARVSTEDQLNDAQVDELKAAGFLEALPPSGFDVPNPSDQLGPDEDPYIEGEDEQPELATGGPEPL